MHRRYVGEPNPVSSKSPLGEQLVQRCVARAEPGPQHSTTYQISNRDRTFGARLSHVIAERFGDDGADPDTFDVTAHGSAGQSFGAFNVRGLNLTLIGEANDYVGKGMAGGRIVITATEHTTNRPMSSPGNTLLYGATGGELYIAGRVGERFAVRNSGAIAIVEGVGDHGCEYMTGGLAIILGAIGYNFAAGMTGGMAYVYDEDGRTATHINPQLVRVEASPPNEIEGLQDWLTLHAQLTSSQKAQAILRDWPENCQVLAGRSERSPAPIEPLPVRSFAVTEPALRSVSAHD